MDIISFSKNHIWTYTNEVNNVMLLGLSSYATEQLGAIMFINLPDVGTEVVCGKVFGDVESIKTVSDLISPVRGKVIEVNEELADAPELLNEDPYANWIVKIEVIESAIDSLMTESDYNKYVGGL